MTVSGWHVGILLLPGLYVSVRPLGVSAPVHPSAKALDLSSVGQGIMYLHCSNEPALSLYMTPLKFQRVLSNCMGRGVTLIFLANAVGLLFAQNITTLTGVNSCRSVLGAGIIGEWI